MVILRVVEGEFREEVRSLTMAETRGNTAGEKEFVGWLRPAGGLPVNYSQCHQDERRLDRGGD